MSKTYFDLGQNKPKPIVVHELPTCAVDQEFAEYMRRWQIRILQLYGYPRPNVTRNVSKSASNEPEPHESLK